MRKRFGNGYKVQRKGRGSTHKGGEEALLQKGLGQGRMQEYNLILEFNIFYCQQ